MTMFKYFSHQLPGRIFNDKYLVLGLARYVGAYNYHNINDFWLLFNFYAFQF